MDCTVLPDSFTPCPSRTCSKHAAVLDAPDNKSLKMVRNFTRLDRR